MRNFILAIGMVSIVSITISCKKDNNKDFSFTEYPYYQVSYQGHIDSGKEYLLLNDTTEFNSYLQPDPYADDQIWINPDAFENKTAVAIIKEYNGICSCPELTITSIESVDSKIIFKYTITGFQDTGDMICDMICWPNLLVLIDKDSFTSIDFYENDIFVRTIIP